MRTFCRAARAFALVLASIVVVTVAAPRAAHAATVSFDYVLAASDPLTDGPCGPTPPANYHYRVAVFSVDVTGTYAFTDQLNQTGIEDGYIGIYDGPYDPADPAAGCIAAVDDDDPVPPLTAGTTYVIVMSSFNRFATGTFRYEVGGPGTFQTSPYAPLASSTVLSARPKPCAGGRGGDPDGCGRFGRR